jgi:hypothetical protein
MISNKKGQGSFLSGDLPAIIMIVISITFFLSSLFMAVSQFNSSRGVLDMEAALVDASSAFLQENARIKPAQIGASGAWADRRDKIEQSYGVQVHISVEAIDPNSPACTPSTSVCETGTLLADPREMISKRFPVALESGSTELQVYPAIATVSVYRE